MDPDTVACTERDASRVRAPLQDASVTRDMRVSNRSRLRARLGLRVSGVLGSIPCLILSADLLSPL